MLWSFENRLTFCRFLGAGSGASKLFIGFALSIPRLVPIVVIWVFHMKSCEPPTWRSALLSRETFGTPRSFRV